MVPFMIKAVNVIFDNRDSTEENQDSVYDHGKDDGDEKCKGFSHAAAQSDEELMGGPCHDDGCQHDFYGCDGDLAIVHFSELFVEQQQEQKGSQCVSDHRRHGQTVEPEERGQEEVQRNVGGNLYHRDDKRRFRIMQRVENRHKKLVKHQRNQTRSVPKESSGGEQRRFRRKSATLVEKPDYGLNKDHQADGGGND